MLRTSMLAGLMSLVLVQTANAAAPPPSPEVAIVRRLVAELGHRDSRLRDRAEQRLLALAPHALPWVKEATGCRDEVVRRRAMRLLPALEEAILFSPRRITLSVRNQPLATVLEAVKKASGYQIYNMGQAAVAPPRAFPLLGFMGAREKTYSYDFVDVPFWDVIDRIGRDANLTTVSQWGQSAIWLSASKGPRPHVHRAGAFRYAASSIQLTRTLDLSTPRAGTANKAGDRLTLQLEVFAEPRLPFVRADEARLLAAYDDQRQSMLPGPGASRSQPQLAYGGSPLYLTASVSLERRSAKASTIKLMRGVLPVEVLVKERQAVVVEKVLESNGKKVLVGGMEITIDEAKKTNPNFSLRFSVVSKGDDLSRIDYFSRFHLFDDKGNRLHFNSGSAYNGGNMGGATLTYRLPNKDTTPAKLVFVQWETRRLQIPFELRDVLLP